MSGGKKKSGFQITSVTSEYVQGAPESTSVATESSSAPTAGTDQPSISPPYRQPANGRRSLDSQATPTSDLPNGPTPFTSVNPIFQTDRSSSQPGTPVMVRKQSSLEQGGSGGGASRFRVVRLGQGLGEPYKRGRWTCVDFLERLEAEERGLRRVIDSMRHAHSLESLETVGLEGGAMGGAALKPLGHMRAFRMAHMVHSQGTTHMLAQQHRGPEGGAVSGPPSPTLSPDPPPLLRSPAAPRSRNVPPPLRLDVDGAGKFWTTRSTPSSPGPPPGRDSSFHPSLTPIQTPSALALAQSMFGVGGAFQLDDGGSNNSMVAIDNKIEQAMDLVKTHLMMAVREEVELLREQIKELTERNAQLERENYILKALRDRH
ncbi:TSC22 domain family protein 4 [Denticeps clupeoides]|uniref:TSC22 domain family protein 4 n=1 Tax=Denticeps clupeoides TaxID=299321 RepID=A0AAY4BRZ0_9TELE|nr:TSC22 domain family protein 4 [Denticeps clupeoides]